MTKHLLLIRKVLVPSCLHLRKYCTDKTSSNNLMRHLKARIKASGPMSVAEYMKEALTNPIDGYYMKRDVFGKDGDFITSPEVSQIFGESIGIWCLNEWMQCGSPSSVQLVELGPGRGTLSDDILRVFSQFQKMKDVVSVHLVEVSEKLSEIQEEKLKSQDSQTITETQPQTDETVSHYKHCKSKYGPNVYWYKQLADIPRKFSCFVANEFFDALPIYKFQKADGSWREVLVGDCPDNHLQFVLSQGPTFPLVSYLKHLSSSDKRDHLEVCPAAGVVIREIADRISQDGGTCLIADYGHDGDKTDTFRGFYKHQLHDVLKDPGRADLTADVDFSYLRHMAGDSVSIYGPVTQQQFLYNMGMVVRLKKLLDNAKPENRKDLVSGFEMLINPDKMGEKFKFFAMLPKKDKDHIPAGFVPSRAS